MQKVVHIRKDAFDVYIGRGSIWGNPLGIGHDGYRDDVLRKYKEYLVRGEGRHLLQRIGELEGLTLGCYCALRGGLSTSDETRCHGQLLLQVLEHRSRVLGEKAG